jgi:hypothetical protein
MRGWRVSRILRMAMRTDCEDSLTMSVHREALLATAKPLAH